MIKLNIAAASKTNYTKSNSVQIKINTTARQTAEKQQEKQAQGQPQALRIAISKPENNKKQNTKQQTLKRVIGGGDSLGLLEQCPGGAFNRMMATEAKPEPVHADYGDTCPNVTKPSDTATQGQVAHYVETSYVKAAFGIITEEERDRRTEEARKRMRNYWDTTLLYDCEAYASYIMGIVTEDSDNYIEEGVDLSSIIPETSNNWGGYGRVDFYSYNPETGVLYVVDYKAGKGKAKDIRPEESYQLKAYAYCLCLDRSVTKIVLAIWSGKAYEYETTAEELGEWGFNARAANLEAFLGMSNEMETAGEHCYKCPLFNAGACKGGRQSAANEYAKAIMSGDYATELKAFALVKRFAEMLREEIRTEAKNGETFEGIELKRRYSTEWTDADKAREIAEANGLEFFTVQTVASVKKQCRTDEEFEELFAGTYRKTEIEPQIKTK